MAPRLFLILLALSIVPATAAAQPAPRSIGSFGAWTAATLTEAGGRVCYAFTRASRSEGVPGRSGVLLTVTHRPGGRDGVVIAAGYAVPRDAEASVTVGATELAFYTAGRSLAPRDAAATLRAFRGGQQAVARAPGPNRRGQAVDTFTLAGFGQAYDAISRECPAGARR